MATAPPTSDGFSAVVQALGPLLKGLGSIAQGFQAQRAYGARADLLKDQARREGLVARRESLDYRRKQSRLQAARRVGSASSGISGSTGSALAGSQALAGEVELGALDILNAGQARAAYYRNSAAVNNFQGGSALISGLAEAGSTIMTADFSFADSFFTGDEESLDNGLPQFNFGPGRRERLPGRV